MIVILLKIKSVTVHATGAQTVSTSPDVTGVTPIMEGVMTKRGHFIKVRTPCCAMAQPIPPVRYLQNWKERYFVLRANGTLTYSKAKGSTEDLGTVSVLRASVTPADKLIDKPNSMHIGFPKTGDKVILAALKNGVDHILTLGVLHRCTQS